MKQPGHPGVWPCFSCMPRVMYTPRLPPPGVPGAGSDVVPGTTVNSPRGCHGNPLKPSNLLFPSLLFWPPPDASAPSDTLISPDQVFIRHETLAQPYTNG